MPNELTNEEKVKINDFMNIFRKYLNEDNNSDKNEVIDVIIDLLIKVYLDYKSIVPYVEVEDDKYDYYIIRPKDGAYCLLDYLINTVIQNLDSIEFIQGSKSSSYNMLGKTIYINKGYTMSVHDSIFTSIRKKIDKEAFLKLYYKSSLYHESLHMMHYKIDIIKDNTIYVPYDYLSLKKFPPLKKLMSKNKREEEILRRKKIMTEEARERIKRRISLYSVLSDKYDVLSPDVVNNSDIALEGTIHKYEEILFPPIFYMNPVEEAFTECDAQKYSGIFENEMFEHGKEEDLECFYLPVDDDHILMTYSPSSYSFSSSIGAVLKYGVGESTFFRTAFLGKKDLFIELLGKYEMAPVMDLSHRLVGADKGDVKLYQPLLDEVVSLLKRKDKKLSILKIFFPLVLKDGEWVYYTETLDKGTKELSIKKAD